MGVRFLRSSISLSLVIHAFFITACLILSNQRTAPISPRLTLIELEPADVRLKKILDRKDQIKEDESLRRQIVQTEKGEKVKVADKDAFLGETTQHVDRQTVSSNHTTAMGKSAQPQVVPRTSTMSPSEELKREKAEKLAKSGPLSNFGLPILPAAPGRDGADQEQNRKVPEGNWADPGSLPQDYVKGLAESHRTALNTKEYVFYGYFQRIRERLDRAWVPVLRTKLVSYYRSGRQLASDMDHTTKVLVTLNPQGEIVKVQVMSESGTRDLDDAAVAAFNSAGPFPNPPRGIVDRDGQIKIPWEFILKT